ncbi:MAG: hypothetical protein JHC88_19580 [Niveispirillum sp.]|nr:hypothetical protein [Niveispirillum sp.]
MTSAKGGKGTGTVPTKSDKGGKGGPDLLSAGQLMQSVIQKNPALLIDAIKDVADAVQEWQVVKEQEATKREDIRARRDVALEKLRQQGQIMEQFLARSFDKQDRATQGLLDLLDKALEREAPDVLAPLLGALVSTVKASPLGDLMTLDKRMEDGEFTLKLGGKK